MLISSQSGQTGAFFFWRGSDWGATISIKSNHWMGGKQINNQSQSHQLCAETTCELSKPSYHRVFRLFPLPARWTLFFRLYIFYLFYRDVNHFNWRHLNESHSVWVSDWCPLILWQSFESVSNYFSCCKLVSIYGEHRKWKWLSTDCDKETMARSSHEATIDQKEINGS